jgi:hypothetical protein
MRHQHQQQHHQHHMHRLLLQSTTTSHQRRLVVFLILGTRLDTPSVEWDYQNGLLLMLEPCVAVSVYCSSQALSWNCIGVGWVALLLCFLARPSWRFKNAHDQTARLLRNADAVL